MTLAGDMLERAARRRPRRPYRVATTLEQSTTDRARIYNLTAEQAARLRDGGRCDVCREWTLRLQVDHDHGCCPGPRSCGKCVRGFLCQGCNHQLGMVERAAGKRVPLASFVAYLSDRSSIVDGLTSAVQQTTLAQDSSLPQG